MSYLDPLNHYTKDIPGESGIWLTFFRQLHRLVLAEHDTHGLPEHAQLVHVRHRC